MTKTEARYGTVLRLYDNGGKTTDRYTIIPPRWASEYQERTPGVWEALGASDTPFAPQGFGMVVTAVPGKHLGKRINWNALPDQVKRFARQCYPEYSPNNPEG